MTVEMNNRGRVSYSTEERAAVNSFHAAGIKTITGMVRYANGNLVSVVFLLNAGRPHSTLEWRRYERESFKPSLDAGAVRTNARTGQIAAQRQIAIGQLYPATISSDKQHPRG
ncbi:hypothetical protein A9K55_003975 [Cordyceps militaris]|uniref:Uncharacterized protein n=1 Tax=Cordyceps militaris TaxID=73501 RepID=A0A2H4SMV1_CORMI|nr:hypothetical protein A9K55_003975 [Cordyceps militaris]